MSWRRRASWAARIAGPVLIIAATSGKLPHLVLSQAVVSTMLTMVVAPLWLLGRSAAPAGGRRGVSVPAPLAVGLMALGTITVQLPPAVSVLSDGGLVTALVLTALLLGAMAFWSVVVAPARLTGLAACGYVVIGGVPISVPAMFLILAPRDLYAGFHAAAPPAIGGMIDQQFAGFVLFAAVKISIWAVATMAFFAAARESAAPDDDDGGLPVPAGPSIPGWVLGLAADSVTAEEPSPEPSPVKAKATAGVR